jgi:hypothetical protein
MKDKEQVTRVLLITDIILSISVILMDCLKLIVQGGLKT